MRGSITSRGLVPPQRIRLQAGHAYWLGASSSPDLVIVTGAGERHVEVCRSPWRRTQRMERWIAEDLLAHGTRTWLEQHDELVRRAAEGDPADAWTRIAAHRVEADRELVAALRGLLAWRESPLRHDPIAWQYVRATCRRAAGHENEDLWRHAESFGSVGGRGDGAGLRYEIVMHREDLGRLRGDARLVLEEVTEEDVADGAVVPSEGVAHA